MHGGDPETTNNRMELTAAIEALNVLKGHSNVILYTDSKYVMDGINDWMPNWIKRGWKTAARKPVKNKDLWQALDEATQRHEIDWRWVKGHDGNPGNENGRRTGQPAASMNCRSAPVGAAPRPRTSVPLDGSEAAADRLPDKGEHLSRPGGRSYRATRTETQNNMRQIVLDTETTGLSTAQGHRIIEIGCIELRRTVA